MLYLERHTLKDNVPIRCEIFSPQNHLLAIQKMSYIPWGGNFNGVTLYDASERVVLVKLYELDSESMEFTDLIEEKSDAKKIERVYY